MRSGKIHPVKRIGINLLIIICVYLFVSLITCIFMFISKNPTGNIYPISLASFLGSGAISGFILGKFNKEYRISATISSLIFSLLLVIAGLLSSGKFLAILLNALAFIIIFNLLLFLSQVKKKRRRAR